MRFRYYGLQFARKTELSFSRTNTNFAILFFLNFSMGMIAYLLRVSPAELDAYRGNSILLEERLSKDATEDAALYDIDKSWDGIIYLLTGSNSSDTTQPLSRIFFSGQLVDKQQDLGTGPAHYLEPEEVQELHAAIAGIVPGSLKAKFNAAHMKEVGVYPNVWDHDDTADYLVEYFETVQEAFTAAASRGEAIITFVR